MPVLRATALASTPERPGTDLSTLPALRTVLIEPDGRQHLVLHASGCTLQIEVSGVDITSGRVSLNLEVPDTALRLKARQLDMLRRFLGGLDPAAQSSADWSHQTEQLRDAIIALDGRASAATHREVGILLYGEAAVDSDWTTHGLRDRVRRHLARGLTLLAGGYRDLLRQGW